MQNKMTLLVALFGIAGCGMGGESVCEEAMDHLASCGSDAPLSPETCDVEAASDLLTRSCEDIGGMTRMSQANKGLWVYWNKFWKWLTYTPPPCPYGNSGLKECHKSLIFLGFLFDTDCVCKNLCGHLVTAPWSKCQGTPWQFDN